MQTIRLFASPFGGSAIVEAALTLCGLEYETIDHDFDRLGELDALKAVNPLCQIPTLVLEDGRVMTESAAIMLYLGALYPAAGLVPLRSSADHAGFLRWLVFIVANIYPTFTYGDFPKRWVGSQKAQDQLVASTDARRKAHWRYLETVASAGPWFLDGGFSAVDLYVWVMSHWRPGRAWFRRECPKLISVADRLDSEPRLEGVRSRNFAGRQ